MKPWQVHCSDQALHALIGEDAAYFEHPQVMSMMLKGCQGGDTVWREVQSIQTRLEDRGKGLASGDTLGHVLEGKVWHKERYQLGVVEHCRDCRHDDDH